MSFAIDMSVQYMHGALTGPEVVTESHGAGVNTQLLAMCALGTEPRSSRRAAMLLTETPLQPYSKILVSLSPSYTEAKGKVMPLCAILYALDLIGFC